MAEEPVGRPGAVRRRVCRAIISRLLVQEDELSIHLWIGLIATLHRCPEVGDEGDSKVRAVLDGAARVHAGNVFPVSRLSWMRRGRNLTRKAHTGSTSEVHPPAAGGREKDSTLCVFGRCRLGAIISWRMPGCLTINGFYYFALT